MTESKTCRRCNKEKPVDQFEKDSRSKSEDNRTNRCRECKRLSNNKAFRAFGRLKERYPKYGVEIEITKEEVEQLFDLFEDKCCYCGINESEETGSLHLEHIKPLSKAGRNHISNLVISCRLCNSRKQGKPVLTFYREHGGLEYDYLPFLIKYIAYFSKRSFEEVESELVADYEAYMDSKRKAV
ncbi:HNH endonuclease [Bacillus sp. PAMC26568]|nr:HNH endonuclease [Bacillus sp. PAMC26568]